MADTLAELTRAGVAIWLDDLSRARLVEGSLGRLIRDSHVVGVTTNPTIFAKAISGSDHYDAQISELAAEGSGVEKALRMITIRDVTWACDLLRPAYDRSGAVDGRVSIEVDPRLAHDTEKTIAEARRLWLLVDRPNLFIKIPATTAGLPAITACLAEGISVNVTLIFSRRRYGDVMDAFLRGVEGPRPLAAIWPAWPRSPRSSSAASTPRSTIASTPSAPSKPRRCAAGPRSPTPGWPSAPTRRSSLPSVGAHSPRTECGRSGPCGPQPA